MDTGQSQALPTLSTHLPTLTPGDRRRGRGGSFGSTTVCSSNNSHQGLLLRETEGKETFICPLSTMWALPPERHKWSVVGEGRAEREREKGGGELVLFPGLEAAPKGSQGQNLYVSVCPPHSLARLSPLRCSPDTSSHRLACFKDGSTSFRSNSPPGSLGSLWSPAPGLLTVSAVLGFS